MDTRSPIPTRPPLQKRDRGATNPAMTEIQKVVDRAMVRAERSGILVGVLVASVIYIALELARTFL